jgi:DNA-binding transcriptional ArsR family regulator
MSNSTTRNARRIALLKALAHPSRLVIADALQAGERSVAELTELVGADISTVSKHLSLMRTAGLLTTEKRGLQVFHRLKCPCLMTFFECVDGLAPGTPAKTGRK